MKYLENSHPILGFRQISKHKQQVPTSQIFLESHLVKSIAWNHSENKYRFKVEGL